MAAMTSAQISRIVNSLNEMEEKGVVDKSIVKDLDALASEFQAAEKKWLTSTNTRLSFYFYYAARNALFVIAKMKERFQNAQPKNDNPVVAEKSLELVGVLGEILSLTQEGKSEEHVAYVVSNRARQLRDIASTAGLLQTEEKELEGIDEKEINEKLSTVMDTMGEQAESA